MPTVTELRDILRSNKTKCKSCSSFSKLRKSELIARIKSLGLELPSDKEAKKKYKKAHLLEPI